MIIPVFSRYQHTIVVCWGGGLNKYQSTGADANSLRSSLAAAIGAAHRQRSAAEDTGMSMLGITLTSSQERAVRRLISLLDAAAAC